MLKNLKAIREKKNLSQKELGTLIGVEQQTISGYEKDRDPSCEVLIMLANCLDTSTDYLLGRTDNPLPPNRMHEYELDEAEEYIVRDFREQTKPEQQFMLSSWENLKNIYKQEK